jgi:prepilin-type N-terminal cleavage/methylation domain-containing protein
MKPNNKAFTLIELLVAVLIIGILAAIALPQYQKAVWKARYATVLSGMKAIADAEERYFLIYNKFTTEFNALDIALPGTISSQGWAGVLTGPNYAYQLRADSGTDRNKFWFVGTPIPSLESVAFRYTFTDKKIYCTTYTTATAKARALCESFFGPSVKCPSQLGSSNYCYAGHF